MLRIFRSATSSVLVWVLLVMLIVGLAGFGIGFSGGLAGNDVARVGDTGISVQQYGRAVDQEIRSVSNQLGRQLSIDEARQFGIDRIALARLVNQTALDDTATALGLSSGDQTVREQLMALPGFQSAGGFDRDAYTYTLDRMGMTAADFENDLRREATRTLVASAVTAPAAMPDTAARTVLTYVGETRVADWIRLDESNLNEPVPEPTDEQLQAFHATNEARYTRPETKRITYAIATPETVAKSIVIPEAEIRAAYDAAPEEFSTPERRLVDRIGFGTDGEAAEARTAIDTGETDFDAVARTRGLTAEDIDQGMIAASDLAPEAAAEVFATDTPGIIGPVPTPLGPSLFRVNAIFDAQVVSYDDARADLVLELATDQATTTIHDEIRTIEDLIAGGSTLEEVADETVMELGTIDFNAETTGELATDPVFTELVASARQGEETDLGELQSGGYVTVRLEAVEPPSVIPLADIREQVRGDWVAAETASQLQALAEGYAKELNDGQEMPELAGELSVELNTTEPLTRGGVLPGTPPRLLADMFALEAPGPFVVADDGSVIIANLKEISAFDIDGQGMPDLMADLNRQLALQVSTDVLAQFTAALQASAGVTVNQTLVESTLDQFQ